MDLVQIIPGLRGRPDGVADYATILAQSLHARQHVDSAFLLGAAAAPAHHGDLRVLASFDERGWLDALRRAPGAPVLLHYVGYGYAKRGAPLRLWWHLRRIKARGHRIVTLFHEMYAFGPPWRSSFWLSPLQRGLAQALARLSDACVVTRALNAEWLAAHLPRGAPPRYGLEILPVFSNVGEPAETIPWNARERCLVVWSGSTEKSRLYRRRWPQILRLCRRLGLRHVLDLGPAPAAPPPAAADVAWTALGVLPAPVLSAQLTRSSYGLMPTYPAEALAKSSVFAAYAAHGVVPLLERDDRHTADGLQHAVHYRSMASVLESSIETRPDDERTVDALRAWYATHSRDVHAQRFAALLRNDTR